MHVAAAGLVTLLSDFGLEDPYVGIMKGAVKRACARAEIMDLCHQVPAFDVEVGAFFLAAARGRFPPGTVHVGVVDPGVGSARRPLVACAHDAYWIGPDNGLLTQALAGDPRAEVRVPDLERLRLDASGRTFHGRDVFGPLAGLLAAGRFGYSALGARVDLESLAVLPVDAAGPAGGGGAAASGRVLCVDHFGNLLTTIPGPDLAGAAGVAIEGRVVPVVATYSAVERGEPLALVNSYGLVEVAVREGRADDVLGAGRGAAVSLQRGG